MIPKKRFWEESDTKRQGRGATPPSNMIFLFYNTSLVTFYEDDMLPFPCKVGAGPLSDPACVRFLSSEKRQTDLHDISQQHDRNQWRQHCANENVNNPSH